MPYGKRSPTCVTIASMAACPYCGSPYPAGASYCVTCGQPVVTAATAPRPDRTMKVIVTLAVAGGCLLVAIAVSGIVAALIIPNFIDALAKAKQKRTLADMRTIATALESQREQSGRYPMASDAAALGPLLAGHGYNGNGQDAWKHELRYSCLSPAEGACDSYELASGGRDGTFEQQPGGYEEGAFEPTAYDADLVLVDGLFHRWPDGQGRMATGGG